jgi:hypothetical protein
VGERLNAEDIHKEMFPVYGGKCICRVKRFSLGGKRFSDDGEAEREMRKWLRQQSNGLYSDGFDALVKRWDKFINVGGGYVEDFFSGSKFTCFSFNIHLWPTYSLFVVHWHWRISGVGIVFIKDSREARSVFRMET